jgi:heme exporter protein A
VKAFGGRRAVDGVDIALAEGECLAIVGPNGAGKTTMLRMAASLIRPDSGSLTISGHSIPSHAARVRAMIGYLGHQPLLYLDLTAWQNLEFFADLYGVPHARARIEEMLDRVDLLARAYDPVRTFSRGMAQRLGLARLLLHDPRLLLLDEPHAGLDAPGAALLDALLDEARGTRTVMMVTHDLGRALATGDRVIAMRRGRVALEEKTAGLDEAAFRARYEEIAG